MIKARRVKSAKTPKYPTRLQLLEHPSLLERNIPNSWKTNAQIAGLLALLMTSSSCSLFEKWDSGATACMVVAPPQYLSEADALEVIREELAKAGADVSQTNEPIPNLYISERYYENGKIKESRWWSHQVKADLYDPKRRSGRR